MYLGHAPARARVPHRALRVRCQPITVQFDGWRPYFAAALLEMPTITSSTSTAAMHTHHEAHVSDRLSCVRNALRPHVSFSFSPPSPSPNAPCSHHFRADTAAATVPHSPLSPPAQPPLSAALVVDAAASAAARYDSECRPRSRPRYTHRYTVTPTATPTVTPTVTTAVTPSLRPPSRPPLIHRYAHRYVPSLRPPSRPLLHPLLRSPLHPPLHPPLRPPLHPRRAHRHLPAAGGGRRRRWRWRRACATSSSGARPGRDSQILVSPWDTFPLGSGVYCRAPNG